MSIYLEINHNNKNRTNNQNEPHLNLNVGGQLSGELTWDILHLFVPGAKHIPGKLCGMIQVFNQKCYGKNHVKASCAPDVWWLRDDMSNYDCMDSDWIVPHSKFNWEAVGVVVEPTTVHLIQNEEDEKKYQKSMKFKCKKSIVKSETPDFLSEFTPNVVYVDDENEEIWNKIEGSRDTMKARITYKVTLSGSIAAYYDEDREGCLPYWTCRMGSLLEQNGMKSAVYMTEDVEL